jgi:hypothetical protein
MTPADQHENQDESAAGLGRLARLLDGSVSDADHAAGLERLLVSSGASPRFRKGWWLLAAAAVSGLAVFACVIWMRKPAPLEYRLSGPLVADGEWLGVAKESEALSLRFSEGTEIELGPGSKGSVAEVTPDGARVVLGTGLLHARVVHRPRARWTIAAGPYSIEVTGTAFDVGWSTSGERLELRLHDGSVIVHGPSLRDGIRVGAGQRLVAHARTGGAELSSLFAPEPSADTSVDPTSAQDPATTLDPAPAESPFPPHSAHPLPSWPSMLAAGNFRGVLDAAEARGLDASLARGSLPELVALSDAARYVHDRTLARRGLLAERARFPASVEARAAAFVLGRMADDSGSREEALRWYDTYLSESSGGSFAAEALGRKLVVLVRSGNTDSARTVARDYLKRFPRGAHAAYAREILPAP